MDQITVYTDGSCSTMHRMGGWASIIMMGQEKKTLKGYARDTTHQRMELTAVVRTLEYLIRNKLTSSSVLLYTDSQYVTGLPRRREKLIAAGFITKKKDTLPNSDLIRMLFECSGNLRITFLKVKSHQNDSYHEQMNGEVDRLSRKMVREMVERLDFS